METERYPEGIVVSIADFQGCNWKEVLDENPRDDYSSMGTIFSSKAREQIQAGQLKNGKILWLLADACSMVLKPDSSSEPFRPAFIIDGRRSALPEDFSIEETQFLSQIIPFIDHPRLCARLSDLAWLLITPRDPNLAISAIDNYTKIPNDEDTWNSDGFDCWDRAIQLCRMLGKGSRERFQEIEDIIVETFKNVPADNGYQLIKISDLLLKQNLASSEKKHLAIKLEDQFLKCIESADYQIARDFANSAQEWYKRLGVKDKVAELYAIIAESWVSEATERIKAGPQGNLVATSFYENAILTYRKIPNSMRETYDVSNRIEELRLMMNQAGEKSLGEMATIRSNPINISDSIDGARRLVKGKELLEALEEFANIFPGANYDKIEESAKESIKIYPMQSLFSSTHLSADGRVIAKSPSVDFEKDVGLDLVWSEMVKYHTMQVNIVVQSLIWPALDVVRTEHRLRESDFRAIVAQSAITPPDRIELLAKSLYFGFDGDFIGALHILTPQIENLVRYHLKSHGERTTTIDNNGIEKECGLSTLMEKPKVIELFGKDLAFELRAIYCDPIGPNLRNNIAHGLLSIDACQNTHSIYAWWMAFRIIYNSFWNCRNPSTENDNSR